jgi:glyoxylase-like metal-dependent hydrolase (beta-lactamase superfamily II)
VRLFHAPGHSPDGICVYLERERLLFASDTVVTGIVPALGDGDSRTLENSLQALRDMDIEILVPGHGRVLYGSAAVQDWLAWELAYLSGIRTRVGALLGADPQPSEDSLLQAAPFNQLIGDRLPADKHDMPNRHRNTVLKIAQEEGLSSRITEG